MVRLSLGYPGICYRYPNLLHPPYTWAGVGNRDKKLSVYIRKQRPHSCYPQNCPPFQDSNEN